MDNRMKSQGRWIEVALFVVPLLVGLCFLAGTSAHGDSALYRRFILDLHHTGVLPLMRFEWYHPGHYIMVWPVSAAGALLGCWDDPLHAIQLVNFLAAGVAAVTVRRLWLGLFPDHDSSISLLPGLAVATLPGWLWHSQEAMSDIVGAAFLIGVIWRLLAHDLRRDTAWTPYLFTGFLAGWSFVVRLSTVLFLPMMVFLVVRLLLHHRQVVSRRRVLTGLLAGGLVPLALVYGYLILVHGWTNFSSGYFCLSTHNADTAQRLAELGSTILTWGGNLLRGMGPAVFVALPGCVLLAVQQRVFLWLALLTLPYLAAVANNHAGFELRYMIPVMAAVTLGYAAIGNQLRRWPGRWGAWLLVVLVVVQNCLWAFPILDALRARQFFGEVAARRMLAVTPKGSLFIGVATHPFLDMLRDGNRPMGVKLHAGTGGVDSWNRPWFAARDVITHHLQLGRQVYCSTEAPMDGFRHWLKTTGFQEQVVATVPAAGLRESYDQMLACGDPQWVPDDPLRIIRLLPKGPLETVVLHVLPRDDKVPGLRLRIHAPAHAGRDYRIFAGNATTKRIWLNHIDLPFADGDTVFQASIDVGDNPRYGLRGFRGKLDAQGCAEAFAPPRLVGEDKDQIAVAVLFEDAGNLDSACLASAPARIQ